MGQNIVAIWMEAPLRYSLISLKVVALEEVSFRDTQNPKTVVNTWTVDNNHYLLIRDNLRQLIQIQLPKKRKNVFWIFFAFLKSILNFKHLEKKKTLIAYVFPKIPTLKNMVR